MAPKPKAPPLEVAPVEPPPPVGPAQEVHVVLKLRMRLKPPAPEPPPQEPQAAPPAPPSPPPEPPGPPAKGKGKPPPKKPPTPASARKAAAAAAAAAAAEAAAAAAAALLAKPVDPATLALTVKYTPFAGGEQLLGPFKPLKPETLEAPPAPPGAPQPPPVASQEPPPPPSPSPPSAVPYATVEVEHHVKVLVDEAAVRSLAASHGLLALSVTMGTPSEDSGTEGGGVKAPPKPKAPLGGKSRAALDGRPSTPVRSYSAVLMLDCSGLLVGDTGAAASWPDKVKGMPVSLEEVAEGIEAELKLLSIPKRPPTPPPPSPPPVKGRKPAPEVKKKVEEPPPEPELKDLPGDPIGLLHPSLIAQLNPIVVRVQKAKNLPAAPATRAQLDSCAPPALFMRWPHGSLPREQPGLASPWQLPGTSSSAGSEGGRRGSGAGSGADGGPLTLAGPAGAAISRVSPSAGNRYLLFGQPEVFLAGDLPGGGEGALALCREAPLLVEVHDRTAIPEPPEFPVVEEEEKVAEVPGAQGEGAGAPPVTPPPPQQQRPGSGAKGAARPASGAKGAPRPASGARGAGRPGSGAKGAQSQRPGSGSVAGSGKSPTGTGTGDGGNAAAAGVAAAAPGPKLPESEGYVCALARISLLELTRGYTRFTFRANLAPHTTIRGAASLDWTKRPGNYAEAGAVLKGEVRAAAPLSSTNGTDPSLRVFNRALFIMDYRDSDLFHLLEDTVRKNNAWKLGLKEPSDNLPTDVLPPELQARRAAQEAAAQEAAAAAGRTGATGGAGGGGAGPIGAGATGGGLQGQPQASRASFSSGNSNHPQIPRRSSSFFSLQDVNGPPGGGGARLSAITAVSAAVPAVPGGGEPRGVRGTGTGMSVTSQRRESTSPPGYGMALTANDSKRHVLFDSDSDADVEPEEPPTAAELALNALCTDIDRVHLEMRELQALSTTQLSPDQANDRTLDLLTGWHLVDGKERLIVVEGLAEGAMKIVKGIADWALEDPKPEDSWRRRSVLISSAPSLRAASRLYAPLGVDLWISKLRAPLARLLGEPGSFATGRVRPDCVQGLRHLGALRSVAAWSRQAADLALWPSPQQLQLVDKKFGGELLAADVLGVEEEEPESDEEDGGPAMGTLLEDARSAKSSRSNRSRRSSRSRRSCRSARSGRSARSAKSGKGGKGGKGGKQRRGGRVPPLDTRNEDYLRMRREARARRLGRDWIGLNREALKELEASTAHLKESWRTWNPQRAAKEELVAALEAGTLTWKDIADMAAAHAHASGPAPIPGTVSRQDAQSRGWYPHPSPFKWPAPRTRAEYLEIPGKPTEFRIQDLLAPWEDTTPSPFMPAPGERRGWGDRDGFQTSIRGDPSGLFGLDAEYWKTVHAGQEEDLLAARRAEAEEWRRRLVVSDPVMHTTMPVRPPRPAQQDKIRPILDGDPIKRGFKIAHAPSPPVNSQLSVPWTETSSRGRSTSPGAGGRSGSPPNGRGNGGKGGPAALASRSGSGGGAKGSTGGARPPDKSFHNATGKPKVTLHKPPYNQCWTASIHDKYYAE